MKSVAIIGAGISGLTIANILKENFKVKVYEKENKPGGLIRCERIDGSLFHICGGHVFNTKSQNVLDWFWNKFNRDEEFQKSDRNAVVCLKDDLIVPYPIENHIYLCDADFQKNVIEELLDITAKGKSEPENFEEFLMQRFGKSLYELYFRPYNEKVWKRDLKKVPLSWLEGKLPMPSVNEILFNNINKVKEKEFVHSTFWYEKNNGSQYIADKLAQGIEIEFDHEIKEIEYVNDKWVIDSEVYDIVVFCGNIKELPMMLNEDILSKHRENIENLEYHGTTSVFCHIEKNPYSWIYMPSDEYRAHRIICTGNFAESNNAQGKFTATIEFTDYISEEDIKENLKKIPFAPRYITHKYNKYTYPIQFSDTRDIIKEIKDTLEKKHFFMTG
ncbi:MAG: NAD(P)-binding protein, partial [Bacteroidaceae bacterium]|nr:NAD(P)-binding protein [Bacteroidaceae bacterium]